MSRLFLLALLLIPGTLFAHGDIVPYIVGGTDNGSGFPLGGKIITALGDDDTGEIDPLSLGQTVFGIDLVNSVTAMSGDFNNQSEAPGSPAFNNETYSNLNILPFNGRMAPTSQLRMTPVTNLFYWDGLGSPNFSPAPATVNMQISGPGGLLGFVHPTGPATGTFNVSVSTYGASGRRHFHTESTLLIGSNSDFAAPNAPEGVYYFGIQLSSTLASPNTPAPSDTIYLVYKTDSISEATHDLAIDHVAAIPEPGTWAVLALSTVGLLIYRRKRA